MSSPIAALGLTGVGGPVLPSYGVGARQVNSNADQAIPRQEENMLAMWVKVRVKAGERERFLKAIEADARGSERDEPGCLRFNVMRDQQDQNVYYFFEVYRDEAALEAHRAAPHYAVWRRLQTPSTAHPRRRVAILCFLLTSSIGKNANSRGEHSVE
jgi:quinol monooxygenase YgiN